MSTVGTVNSLEVGGRTFVGSDLDDLKVLYGNVSGTNNFTTLRDSGAATTSGYQAPAGGATIWVILPETEGSGEDVNIGYGDTDVGINSGAAPTTPKYYGNGVSSCVITRTSSNGTNVPQRELAVKYVVPANKYVFIQALAAVAYHAHVYIVEG